MLAFVALLAGVGWAAGYLSGFGYLGLALAVGIAVAMTWGSYYASDRIALSMSHAQPANETEYGQLHNIVEALCLGAGLPKPRVYVIDDAAPNAFATGRDPSHAAVAVTTGLVQRMNRDELEGVVAHELAHIKNRDTLVMTISVTLVGAIVLLADWMVRALWWGGARHTGNRGRDGSGAVLAALGLVLLIVAPVFAQLLHFAISRRREFLADAEAVFITRHPLGLINALQRLKTDTSIVRSASRATAHLWIESPIPRRAHESRSETGGVGAWLNRLFDTHPPLDDRIAALQGNGSSVRAADIPSQRGART